MLYICNKERTLLLLRSKRQTRPDERPTTSDLRPPERQAAAPGAEDAADMLGAALLPL